MLIEYNPEDVETKVEHHICEYHTTWTHQAPADAAR